MDSCGPLTLPRPVKISIAGVLPGVPDADCSGAELAWGVPVELSRLEPAVTVASPGVPGDGSPVRPHVVCSHATCSGVKGLAMVEAGSSTTARLSSRWSCNDCLYNCIYCIPLLLIETSLMEQTPTELQDLTPFANCLNALSPNVFR